MLDVNAPREIKTSHYSNLKEQVAQDLTAFLGQFPSKTVGISSLCSETGLNEKTLRRLLKKENIPSNQTLYKLYAVFLESSSKAEMLKKCPPIIKNQIERFEPDGFEKTHNSSEDLKLAFKKDPVLLELYLTLGVKNLEVSHILYHYGQYGLKSIEKLVELGFVNQLNSKTYSLSKKQPHLNAELLKIMGLRLTESFFRSEIAELEGENFIGLYCESLNSEGKKRWLEIDQKAFNEKVKISKDSKFHGDEPVFAFSVIESFLKSKGKQYDN